MGTWSIHKYPEPHSEAAKALRKVIKAENWVWQRQQHDPRRVEARAKDLLASSLLAFGSDTWCSDG